MSMQSVASPAMILTPPKRNLLAHIPGDEGWPVIGRTLAVLADPKGEVERMAAKYGLVYRSRVLGETSISVLGPEANELVLFDQSKLFSSTHGWGTILGRLFPRGLMLLDFDEHRLHRRALSVAFKSGPMKSYLAALDAGIGERVTQWRQTARSDAVLSGDEAAHARSGGHVFSRRPASGPRSTRSRARSSIWSRHRSPRSASPGRARKWRAASRAAPASSPISRNRFRSAAPRAARTCSRSSAAPPTRTARCCRPRISSIT